MYSFQNEIAHIFFSTYKVSVKFSKTVLFSYGMIVFIPSYVYLFTSINYVSSDSYLIMCADSADKFLKKM